MIKDFIDGQKADGVYLVKNVVKGVTTNGLIYLNVTLQDKTGFVEAKKWEVTPADSEVFKIGNIVKIQGDALLYRDKIQVKIFSGEIADIEKENVENLLLESPKPVDELVSKFKAFKDSVKNPDCIKILNNVMGKYYDKYINYPAATTNHHEFYHGLIYHSVSMAEIADFLASHYPEVDRDIVLTGCLLHDIGKVIEFSGVVATKYTVEGNLVGHISIGAHIVRLAGEEEGITSEVPMLLEHMILAHHGKHEFGSPVLPETREALLLSMVDELDSKMQTLKKVMEGVEPGGFSEKIFQLENRSFYKPKK